MKPWPIITEDDEVHIALPEFYDTYFGDADSMTPEEWRIVHQISATPMLLAACKAQDVYAKHGADCSDCRDGYVCQEGFALWLNACDTRADAIAQAEEAR